MNKENKTPTVVDYTNKVIEHLSVAGLLKKDDVKLAHRLIFDVIHPALEQAGKEERERTVEQIKDIFKDECEIRVTHLFIELDRFNNT